MSEREAGLRLSFRFLLDEKLKVFIFGSALRLNISLSFVLHVSPPCT